MKAGGNVGPMIEDFLPQDIGEIFEKIITKSPSRTYLELRFLNRVSQTLLFQDSRLEDAMNTESSGVGVRVLCDGAWGFSPTFKLAYESVLDAVKTAIRLAKLVAETEAKKVVLAPTKSVTENFIAKELETASKIALEEKISIMKTCESIVLDGGPKVQSCSVFLREPKETKVIYTSDGTKATIRYSKPDFYISTVAKDGIEHISHTESVGGCGGWEILGGRTFQDIAVDCRELALPLLKAERAR